MYTQSYTEQAVARAHVTTEDETANATFDSHDARYEAARTHIDFLNSVSDAVQLACVRAKLEREQPGPTHAPKTSLAERPCESDTFSVFLLTY